MKKVVFIQLISICLCCSFYTTAQPSQKKIDSLNQIITEHSHDTATARACINLYRLLASTHHAPSAEDKELLDQALHIAETQLNSDQPQTSSYLPIKIDALSEISDYFYLVSDLKSALEYRERTCTCLKQLDDTRAQAKCLYKASMLYQRVANMEKFTKASRTAAQLYTQTGDSITQALALLTLADYYFKSGQPDTAIVLDNEAYHTLKQTTETTYLAYCLKRLAIFNLKTGAVEKALTLYFDLLQLQKAQNHSQGVTHTLMDIGLLYKQQGDLDRAMKFYQEAAKQNEQMGNKEIEAKVYHHIGGIYSAQGNYHKSLKYHQKSLQIVETYQMGPVIAALCLSNIGKQYQKLGKLRLALEYLESGLATETDMAPKIQTAYKKLNIAAIYMELKNLPKARTYAESALAIAQQLGFPAEIAHMSELLAQINEQEGHFKTALNNLKLSISMKDSVQNSAIDKLLIEKEAGYQIDQKEQEVLRKEQQIQLLEKEHQINYRLFLKILAGLVLVVISLLWWFKSYRKKRDIYEREARQQLQAYLKEIDFLKTGATLPTSQLSSTTTSTSVAEAEPSVSLSLLLSKRELDVLHQLSKGQSNQEIADALHISVNTVRSHLLRIYDKLEVKNRTQAVQKAESLQLLSSK